MELQPSNGPNVQNPQPADIETAFKKPAKEDEQVIISLLKDNGASFLETVSISEQGWALRYLDGDSKSYFLAKSDSVPTDKVIEIFLKYAAGDAGWRNLLEWEAEPGDAPKPSSPSTGISKEAEHRRAMKTYNQVVLHNKKGCSSAVMMLLLIIIALSMWM